MTNGRHRPPGPPDDHSGRRPAWARFPWTSGNRSRRALVAAGVVGLCAVVTGVSVAAFSSPGNQAGHVADAGNGGSSAAAGRSPEPTPPVASSTTGPDVTSAGIAKTALQYPAASKNQMTRWAAGRGGAALSAVTTQPGDVSQAGGMGMYSQLRLECARLISSVQAARSAPPIPDEVMQHSYTKVLAKLSVTATGCRNAISVRQEGDEGQRINENKVLLNRSLAQFVAESKELYTATAEIRICAADVTSRRASARRSARA